MDQDQYEEIKYLLESIVSKLESINDKIPSNPRNKTIEDTHDKMNQMINAIENLQQL